MRFRNFKISILWSPPSHPSFWEAWPTSVSSGHIKAWIRLWHSFDRGLVATEELPLKGWSSWVLLERYILSLHSWWFEVSLVLSQSNTRSPFATQDLFFTTLSSHYSNESILIWSFSNCIIGTSSIDVIWLVYHMCEMWTISLYLKLYQEGHWTRRRSSLSPPSFCILQDLHLYSKPLEEQGIRVQGIAKGKKKRKMS